MGTEREAWELAEKIALETGFDQIIFKNRNSKYIVGKTSKYRTINPKKVVGYMRLTYKDKILSARAEVA